MLEKVKKIYENKKGLIYASATGLTATAASLPVVCHAEDTTSGSSVQTALEGAFQQVQTDSMSYIQSALVPALVIMGTVLAITIGIKVFKRFTKG